MFQRVIAPLKCSASCTASPLQMKVSCSYRMLGIVHVVTQNHHPEDLNHQAYPCKNVRSHKNVVQCEHLLSEMDCAEVVLG